VKWLQNIICKREEKIERKDKQRNKETERLEVVSCPRFNKFCSDFFFCLKLVSLIWSFWFTSPLSSKTGSSLICCQICCLNDVYHVTMSKTTENKFSNLKLDFLQSRPLRTRNVTIYLKSSKTSLNKIKSSCNNGSNWTSL
jgi:hypothetical protein